MKEKIKNIIRFALGIFFWIYVPTKVFIYDFDLLIFNKYFPDQISILKWKLLFFIVILIFYFLFFGFKSTIHTTIYVIFFPLILFFKGAMKFIRDNYIYIFSLLQKHALNLLFFFTTFISNLLKHFRFRLISFLVFCLVSILALFSNNGIVLKISQYYLFLYLFIHFVYRIYTSLAPPNLFTKLISSLDELEKKNSINDDLNDKNSKIPYEERKLEELSILAFVIVKGKVLFQSLKDSPRLIVYFILSLIYTICLTVFSIALIHYSEFKINPIAYKFFSTLSFGDFFHFTLRTLLFMENQNIVAIGSFSNFIITLTGIIRVVIGGIYTVLLLNVVKNQYNYTLNAIIQRFDIEENRLKQILSNRFNTSIDDSVNNFAKLFDPKNSLSSFQSKIITAKLAIQAKNFPNAKKILSEMAEKNEINDEVYYLLGYLHGEDKDYLNMLNYFNKSLELSKNFEKNISEGLKYHWVSLFNKAVQFYNEGIKIENINEREKYLSKSAEYFKNALLLKPDSDETKLNYCYSLKQSGDEISALNFLEKWIKEKPTLDSINFYSSIQIGKLFDFLKEETQDNKLFSETLEEVETILLDNEHLFSTEITYLQNMVDLYTIKANPNKIEEYRNKIKSIKDNQEE